MNQTRLLILLAEVAAMAIIRVLYIMKRDGTLPKGAKVNKVHGRPVYNPSMGKHYTNQELNEDKKNKSADEIKFDDVYKPPPK